ncbi:MAG: protein-disulfide reductase DsbD domain-containing protein, partial [Vicinamibacterales bacterium]
MRTLVVSSIVAALVFGAPTGASAQLKRIPAEIVPVVETDGVRAGTTVRAALQVTLPEGFHVQSNKPRDASLIATELAVESVAGVHATEIVFPDAIDFVQEGLPEPLLVFEREFVVGVRLAIPADAPAGVVTLPARLRYQACDDSVCFAPATATAEWSLRIVPATAAVTAQHAAILDPIAFGSGEVPPPPTAAGGPALVGAPPPVATTAAGLGALERFAVVATTGGYQGTADFMTFIRNAEAGITEQGMFEGRGPLAILLLVLVGGLALNLTPCVLPMIPINLAIIGAGAQAGSRRRGFLLGLTYGGAMAVVYGVLGLVVVLTASTFGTINASPWFNLGIALLFVALALAMFDVFEIDFSRFAGTVGAGASRGTLPLAF